MPNPPWCPPTVDAGALLVAADGASRPAAVIRAAPDGVLVLRNALEAPFDAISDLFDGVTPGRAQRANAAYLAGGSKLVWKDAHGEGRGGPHHHQIADPALAQELGAPLQQALAFFGSARDAYCPLLVAALREATGYEFAEAESRHAFRLVDYTPRQLKAGAGDSVPPRCGAHRDFGPATLIWPGGECSDGLEVRVGGAWRRLPHLPSGSAVFLFGLCTAWRSNDRIRAAEHRVADDPALLGSGGVSPRRLSAVLFVGLCDSAELAPALVSPGERPRYRTKLAGEVQPTVRRKWSWREGSVTEEEARAEAEERSRFESQEALIAALYKL
ncbi:2OG-Fe(II) oxygenase family [Micractinium conductrix]|uniref:2OG-Fe(II) oxygenase family n=1 Tax=Micractinium conductrix TaxID=554055 RepID=A0A2P6VG81_9CHLO|nr:2OG-Fe(II) oxygenase family [Micractinium conductrix]|eukprot:PSC73078.1 2OG-Fe(II) oxygenase family [Micractinium conductrix]